MPRTSSTISAQLSRSPTSAMWCTPTVHGTKGDRDTQLANASRQRSAGTGSMRRSEKFCIGGDRYTRPRWIRMASPSLRDGRWRPWRLGSNHLDAAVRLREGHESRGLMRAIGLEDDLAISDRPSAVAVPRSATMLCGVETARG
jgi:hypothetical protein